MKKLRLVLESIEVESFAADGEAADEARGTVRAQADPTIRACLTMYCATVVAVCDTDPPPCLTGPWMTTGGE
jgi:hypothetical protein